MVTEGRGTQTGRCPRCTWTEQLAAWASELPRPRAILIVSAHRESARFALGVTDA